MAINEFNKLSIYVNAPGMYTTIQDKGRVGFQQYGMPVAVLWIVKAISWGKRW